MVLPDPDAGTLDVPTSPLPPRVPNIDRLNKVADMIQEHPEHFDMQRWYSGPGMAYDPAGECFHMDKTDLFSCGTTACIAGWACYLWAAEYDTDDDMVENGGSILGLDYADAERLFNNWELLNADDAADHLRRMALDYEASA